MERALLVLTLQACPREITGLTHTAPTMATAEKAVLAENRGHQTLTPPRLSMAAPHTMEKVDVMVVEVQGAGLLSLVPLNFAQALKGQLGLFGALVDHSPI